MVSFAPQYLHGELEALTLWTDMNSQMEIEITVQCSKGTDLYKILRKKLLLIDSRYLCTQPSSQVISFEDSFRAWFRDKSWGEWSETALTNPVKMINVELRDAANATKVYSKLLNTMNSIASHNIVRGWTQALGCGHGIKPGWWPPQVPCERVWSLTSSRG